MGIANVWSETKFLNRVMGLICFIVLCASAAKAQIQGPVYPPPTGTLTFTSAGSGGSIISGGQVWSFSDVTMAASSRLLWGVSNNGVSLNMGSGASPMTYNANVSTPSNGVLVWEGQSTMAELGSTPIYTRFVMTLANQSGAPALSFTDPASLGLSTNLGELVSVGSTNTAWSASMIFEASLTYGSGYEPALSVYNAYHHIEGAEIYSSVQCGFYYAGAPQLQANGPLTVSQGSNAVITTSLLDTTSSLADSSELTYTIPTDTNYGGSTYNGTLYLNGVALTNGSTFTQSEIDAGDLVYANGGSCQTNDDFEFSVSDTYGNTIPGPPYYTYSFPITINPVTNNPTLAAAYYSCPVGGSVSESVTANNVNCFPETFSYSVVTNAAKGTVSMNSSGAFTYTAGLFQSGADKFYFEATNAVYGNGGIGVVYVTIVRVPPLAYPGTNYTTENTPVSGTFTGSDPNRPVQPLTFQIVSNRLLGTATLVNSNTGAFIYTPNSNAFGEDIVYFDVVQGTNVSSISYNEIFIHPTLDGGHVLLVDQGTASVIEIDPVNYYASLITSSNLLTAPVSIAIEPAGTILVGDASGGLVRVNHATGAQTTLASHTNFAGPLGAPSGIAIDPAGGILVADLTSAIQKVDPVTGAVSTLTTNGTISAAFGIAVGANREIYVTDAGAFVGAASKLVEVDPNTGAQTALITTGLGLPTGIAASASNILYFCDTASFIGSTDSIDEWNLGTSSGGVWITNSDLEQPIGIGFGLGQLLYISENKTGVNFGFANPATAAFTAIGPVAKSPFGIAVATSAPKFISTSIKPAKTFSATISAEPGRFVAIEYSTNLTNWQYVAGLPVVSNTVTFTDSTTNGAARFYRAFSY